MFDDLPEEPVRDGLVFYVDYEGNPIGLRSWVQLREGRERLVDETPRGTVVTTYLGDNDGYPVPVGQVATRVFGSHVLHSDTEVFTRSWDDARRAHQELVAWLLGGPLPQGDWLEWRAQPAQ